MDNTDTIFPFIRHTEFLGFGLLRERSIQSFSQDDCTILSEIFRIVIGAYFQINKQETDFSKEIFDQQQAHRDKILRTTNDVTNIFNSEISFEQRMNEALRVVGESVGVDRVYVYQNVREENGGCFVEQIFLWESANVPPKNRSDRFISAEEIAIKKQPDQRFLNARISDKPRGWEDSLQDNVLSLLVVQFFLNDQYWGFIGFDNCHSERLFAQ